MEAKKSLGQHWLNDEESLNSIVQTAGVAQGDTVLEVGPGHGSLTSKLLAKGANVIAVEKDEQLTGQLKDKFQAPQFQLYAEDILKFNLNELPKGYKVVANIPYYLTSKLIRVLSESPNPPAAITLLVQKEVAERICAVAGQMSLLSVSAQFYHECELGIVVPAAKFNPPPKVDSQVVHMVRKTAEEYQDIDIKPFFQVVRAGFSSRRKTLVNNLSASFHKPKEEIAKNLQFYGIDTKARAQTLSIEQWVKLTSVLT